MFRQSKEDVVRNLKDAGCSQQTIEQFIECLKRGTLSEQMELLSRHRDSLLDQMHREQRRIDCLDYLVYQMQREQTADQTNQIRREQKKEEVK